MAPWTEIAERKLLLTLIDLKVKKDWEYSARLMGFGYSAEACRYVSSHTYAVLYK
jgi:hypothetical protein